MRMLALPPGLPRTPGETSTRWSIAHKDKKRSKSKNKSKDRDKSKSSNIKTYL